MIVSLFASSHAMLAFHYCGGSLDSVRIIGSAGTSSCCERENNNQKSSEKGNIIQNTPCCSNQLFEIKTDNFPTTHHEIIIGGEKNFHPIAFTFYPASGLYNIDTPQIFQFIFPPGSNLAKSGTDLLTFVCVLRI